MEKKCGHSAWVGSDGMKLVKKEEKPEEKSPEKVQYEVRNDAPIVDD